ncbi:DUF4331 domain-containing protein [Aquabacterium sp.]|uniref:DUF4331 domain-containing protein n=1 Tax=Aquabacterium sp. TaxID=1872578 RepID=UPI003D6D46A3
MPASKPPSSWPFTRLSLVASALSLLASSAMASSHREAPFITTAPKVDATDFYIFNSYEGVASNGTGGKSAFVTLIANYLPLQDAYGGPNYFSLDPNALYEIHVDNNGDAVEDITLQFRFKNTLNASGAGITLPIGPTGAKKNVSIPLRQAGGISGVSGDPLSFSETYEVFIVRGDRRTGTRQQISIASGSPTGETGTTFTKPIDYIGEKTLGDAATYDAYANKYIYNITIPGCSTPGRVFVGQRKEAFSVNLGRIFDLVNAPASVITNEANAKALNGTNDANEFGELSGKNVTSLAVEMPASCLTASGPDKVIGAWTTASLRQARLLDGKPKSGLQASEKAGGAWTQVSRLGMPLVNEVVIGLKDKDKFNASKPKDDAANFADYVTHPTLPALVQVLFPTAVAPTNFPRKDLMTAFLTGLPTVNRPANITDLTGADVTRHGPLAEMLRLNTALPPTQIASQNPLGVAGGDLAGFPNGRRLGDDVVDLSLRVAMGALCTLTGSADALMVGCHPSDAPVGGLGFNDAVRADPTHFKSAFPYLNTPLPGAKSL